MKKSLYEMKDINLDELQIHNENILHVRLCILYYKGIVLYIFDLCYYLKSSNFVNQINRALLKALLTLKLNLNLFFNKSKIINFFMYYFLELPRYNQPNCCINVDAKRSLSVFKKTRPTPCKPK